MDLILDTSIIIEIFGGNERVYKHLKNQGNKVFGITSVTEFEFFCVHYNHRVHRAHREKHKVAAIYEVSICQHLIMSRDFFS